MGVQESLNQVIAELTNRWIKLTGTADPNVTSSLDVAPIGTTYAQTDTIPFKIYAKNRAGTNGWDFMSENMSAVLSGRLLYVNPNYTGTLQNGNFDTPFKTIQAAVNYAEASMSPTPTNRAQILFTGTCDEEVRIHKTAIDISGYGTAILNNTTLQAKTDNFIATGAVNERFEMSGGQTCVNPQVVVIAGVTWTYVSNFNSSGPLSTHYIVRWLADGRGVYGIELGNGVKGKLANPGDAVVVTYNKVLPSLVLSNGSNASITTYHATDNYADLVYVPGDPVATTNDFRNFQCGNVEVLGVKGDVGPFTGFGMALPGFFFSEIGQIDFSNGHGIWYIRNASFIEIVTGGSLFSGNFLSVLTVYNVGFVVCTGAVIGGLYVNYNATDICGQPIFQNGGAKTFRNGSITRGTATGSSQFGIIECDLSDPFVLEAVNSNVFLWDCDCSQLLTVGKDTTTTLINCVFNGGLTALSGGTGGNVTLRNCDIYDPCSDVGNRIVWSGKDSPPARIRHVDPGYTGTYSNGSERYPYLTEILARASSATAKLKLSGYEANTDVDIGTEVVDEFPDTVGKSAIWTVQVSKGANVSLILATATWDAASDAISIITTSTQASVGVIDVTLSVGILANSVQLKATAISNDWIVQVVEREIYA